MSGKYNGMYFNLRPYRGPIYFYWDRYTEIDIDIDLDRYK